MVGPTHLHTARRACIMPKKNSSAPPRRRRQAVKPKLASPQARRARASPPAGAGREPSEEQLRRIRRLERAQISFADVRVKRIKDFTIGKKKELRAYNLFNNDKFLK